MERTLVQNSPKLHDQTIAAWEDGFGRADEQLRGVAA